MLTYQYSDLYKINITSLVSCIPSQSQHHLLYISNVVYFQVGIKNARDAATPLHLAAQAIHSQGEAS